VEALGLVALVRCFCDLRLIWVRLIWLIGPRYAWLVGPRYVWLVRSIGDVPSHSGLLVSKSAQETFAYSLG
jgi:hypothetical protein